MAGIQGGVEPDIPKSGEHVSSGEQFEQKTAKDISNTSFGPHHGGSKAVKRNRSSIRRRILLASLRGMDRDNPTDFDLRSMERLRKYRQQIDAFEGFHVDIWYLGSADFCGKIVKRKVSCEITQAAARFAVEEYNKDKVEESKLELKRIVKANSRFGNGEVFFLTLEATNECFYEAKLYFKPLRGNVLYFFRDAKHYPMQALQLSQ